jgi:hypothetical protein
MIDTSRGKRLFGKSRMNFVALVIHGLSAISVFGEVVATRLLISACGMSILLIGALVAVIAVRLFTDHAVSGWATYTGGILMILLVLIATITSGFLLSVLSNRNMASFLPLRDAPFQIRDTKRIYAASKESDVPRK